ncbi:hypothetical protein QYE76_064269 [Lolium multiflorum]|uniref:NB-ARC domain-containing protein n=1 Tax=Lolium multiflorum TaxID=4521 RepID=A0AAD8S743_LOLMU|nr:hypothetical protein QYE76_064269 [Lolium multiflorum]
MEATLLSEFIQLILPKLSSLAFAKYKLHRSIKDDIRFLEKELRMIHGAIDDHQLPTWKVDKGCVLSLSIEELREVAHHIEDCIDRFIYQAACEQDASLLRRVVRYPRDMQSRQRLAAELHLLKKTTEEAHLRKERYSVFAGQSSPMPAEESAYSCASDPRILDTDLVGIDIPRKELLEQLQEGQQKLLKVISIVGSGGSGKTVLARVVYNSDVGQRFSVRAWVSAADRSPRQVLVEILQELGRPVSDNSDVGSLAADLREHLHKKRYFIVIDDMRTDHWGAMESAFKADNGVSSRVMVTTTVHSVANACSSGNGYVHKVRRLGKKHSKQLFFKKACPKEYSGYMEPDSAAALKKCDGQPLAIVSMSQFFRKMGWPTRSSCQKLCRQLGRHLEKDETLERMRRVLTHSYASLKGHAPKACLLYFGLFPSDRLVRRKSLMRRWLAEGFVHTESSSCENFDMLLDRNIIEPIDVGSNNEVKTCRTYGMMREFILHMSTSQNLNTLFCNGAVGRKYVRRLSLHPNTPRISTSLDIDLSLVRSLTVFGEAGDANFDLHKYQLLRVLGLEECTYLGDDHLKHICNLLLLKYLGLGSAFTSLPKGIEKLKLLETLDLRRTKVEVLPIEVILLPSLIHLFGKFKISDKVKRTSELQNFLLSGQCNLETLAGFVTDQSQGFPQILSHMKKLRKVKIWCERTASSTNLSDLELAIQKFIHDEKEETHESRSLSLHFDEHCSEDILNSLKEPCYLTSLKITSKLLELPRFVKALRDLRELCLSSTKLTAVLLAALTELRSLKYLKLIADHLEEFIIKDQAFPRLLRLCFVLQCPTLPKIEEGALPYLMSLQLICKDLVGLADMKIEHLRCLKEVTLDQKVTLETREAWEKAAKEHPNRPKVLLFKTIDPTESEHTDHSVDSEPEEHEIVEASVDLEEPEQVFDSQMLVNKGSGSYAMTKKRKYSAVQSSSNGEASSSFDDMGTARCLLVPIDPGL